MGYAFTRVPNSLYNVLTIVCIPVVSYGLCSEHKTLYRLKFLGRHFLLPRGYVQPPRKHLLSNSRRKSLTINALLLYTGGTMQWLGKKCLWDIPIYVHIVRVSCFSLHQPCMGHWMNECPPEATTIRLLALLCRFPFPYLDISEHTHS